MRVERSVQVVFMRFSDAFTVDRVVSKLWDYDPSFYQDLELMSVDQILVTNPEYGTVLHVMICVLMLKIEGGVSGAALDFLQRVLGPCDDPTEAGGVVKHVKLVKKKLADLCKDMIRENQERVEGYEQRRDAFVAIVADAIELISTKIAQRRMEIQKNDGSNTYKGFVYRVSQFLSYKVELLCNEEMNCIQAVMRLYLFSRGNKPLLDMQYKVLERFLIGFAHYELGDNGERSIHYALSLCNTADQHKLLNNVVKPLFVLLGISQKGARCEPGVLSDRRGNTLLHYAVSSACCADKVVAHVLAYFPEMVNEKNCDGLTPLDVFFKLMPVYALFSYLEYHNYCCGTLLQTYKEFKEIPHQSKMEIRVMRDRTRAFSQARVYAANMRGASMKRFMDILHRLYMEDMRFLALKNLRTSTSNLGCKVCATAPECMRDYQLILDEMNRSGFVVEKVERLLELSCVPIGVTHTVCEVMTHQIRDVVCMRFEKEHMLSVDNNFGKLMTLMSCVVRNFFSFLRNYDAQVDIYTKICSEELTMSCCAYIGCTVLAAVIILWAVIQMPSLSPVARVSLPCVGFCVVGTAFCFMLRCFSNASEFEKQQKILEARRNLFCWLDDLYQVNTVHQQRNEHASVEIDQPVVCPNGRMIC